jgi:hypothetical protein
MRTLFFLIPILICSCGNSKIISQKEDRLFFKVKKIDSINNWYIIYASKQDSLFKIVVKKEITTNINCSKIIRGQSYDFKLHSRKTNYPEINGIKINPGNSLDIACYTFDENTNICIEPKKGIYDLYYAENLKGLCILK